MSWPAGPPPTRSSPRGVLLGWLVGGGFVLAVVLTVVLSRPWDTGGPVPSAASPTSSPAPAQDGRFGGSGAIATAWVQALAEGDAQRAFDLSCPPVQASSAVADPQDPARGLANYVTQEFTGGEGFTVGTLDAVVYDANSNTDRATFTLRTDSGRTVTLLVYVTADLRICDFR